MGVATLVLFAAAIIVGSNRRPSSSRAIASRHEEQCHHEVGAGFAIARSGGDSLAIPRDTATV